MAWTYSPARAFDNESGVPAQEARWYYQDANGNGTYIPATGQYANPNNYPDITPILGTNYFTTSNGQTVAGSYGAGGSFSTSPADPSAAQVAKAIDLQKGNAQAQANSSRGQSFLGQLKDFTIDNGAFQVASLPLAVSGIQGLMGAGTGIGASPSDVLSAGSYGAGGGTGTGGFSSTMTGDSQVLGSLTDPFGPQGGPATDALDMGTKASGFNPSDPLGMQNPLTNPLATGGGINPMTGLPIPSGSAGDGTPTGSPSWLDNLFGPGTAASGVGNALTKLLGGGSNGLFGNILGAGANYAAYSSLADKYIQAAKDLQKSGNPLNDPQRQEYQQQLSKMEANPADFWNTNPVAKGQLDLANNQFQANSAKMGTGGTQFSNYLKNVMDVSGKTFNDQATLLGGLGGFNLPAQGTTASANLTSQGIANQGAAFQGIGNLFGSNIMTPANNKIIQPSSNPVSGASVQNA